MTFVKTNPRQRRATSVNPFFNLMTDLVTNSVGELEKNMARTRPLVNVMEGKEDFQLEIAAPGLNKSDFEINVEKELLTVSTNVKKETTENMEDSKYIRKEFEYSNFKRTFQLPKTIDITKIEAHLNNGILTLVLAKKEEAKELPPRIIEVK